MSKAVLHEELVDRTILEINVLVAEAHAKRDYRPVAVGLLKNAKGEILLLQSAINPDEWMWPQGGIEHDEYAHEALLREIHEEAGIPFEDLLIGRFLFMRDLDAPTTRKDRRGFSKGKRYFFFTVLYSGNGILSLDPKEVLSYRWVTPEKFSPSLTTTRLEKRHLMEKVLRLSLDKN